MIPMVIICPQCNAPGICHNGLVNILANPHPHITLVAKLGVQLPISPATITEVKVGEKLARSDPNPQMTALATWRKSPIVKTSMDFTTPLKLHILKQPKIIR